MLRMIWKTGFFAGLFLALLAPAMAGAETAAAAHHAIAMHGDPKYPPGFSHFDYVNPEAPKGGEIRLATSAPFDNLNGFIIKGVSAPGLAMTYQTLMENADDEAFTEYGLIAESVEMPEDRSSVTFNLRPEARWNDGRPITAEDVVWTFNTLMTKGHPFYRAYYGHVKEAVAVNPRRVTFNFGMAGNRELPLIMGQMPVLPKHYWADRNFEATTLEQPLGSGPYKARSVDVGRRIVYERVKDWWGGDLAINRGRYNFDTIVYDVYRDETVLLQALFANAYDFRSENVAKSWHGEYDQQNPVREGLIRKEEIKHEIPTGMQAFVYNTRRAIFADPKVREALGYAFDFEWSNRQFAFGAYKRTASYFANSELASSGLPAGKELEILEKFRGKIPEEVFTREFANPKTSGSGQDLRANLSRARTMLSDAGWKVGKNGILEKDGKPFRFEILINSDTFQRWINPFIQNLRKLGIEARLRLVETAQYQNRTDSFDFDMTIGSFPQSLSPGNEQLDFWGAEKADVNGSRNIIGIRNPVVDELIGMIIRAGDREELVAMTRALDRVLLWNYYVIPQWHLNSHRIAYWNKFSRPDVTPKYGLGVPDTWWYDAGKAAKIAQKVKPAAKE